ncbi:MAG: hypothetical protein K5793_02795 [Nitrosarchaeum sp.]|nr:hypothetical protein [Nitrosarchaeum sp.]
MAKEGVMVFGSFLFVFGFLGYIVPIGQFGSVTDVDRLCSTAFGQLGQLFNTQVNETCQMVSGLSKVAYSMMGIGAIMAIIGAVVPSKKHSMFVCDICDIAFSSESELYNHNNSQSHLEEISQLSKAEIKEKESIKEGKIVTKNKWRKSPILQGVLVGIVLVIIFWGTFNLSFSQVFVMSNNALSPDADEGDLIHYERIPFTQIKKGDIVVFVPSENSEFVNKVGIVRNVSQNPNYVQTSNNANPDNLDSVEENEYVGKVVSVTSDHGLRSVYYPPYGFIITGILLVIPMIILKIQNRK